MSLYDDSNPNHVAMLEHRRAGWTPEREAAFQASRRQCPHGEPLNKCVDCVREHQQATQ